MCQINWNVIMVLPACLGIPLFLLCITKSPVILSLIAVIVTRSDRIFYTKLLYVSY